MSEGKKLQWIKGDKTGKVETVKSIDGDGWLIFEGGSRISSELVGEFMIDASEGALEIDDLSTRTPIQRNNSYDTITAPVKPKVVESPLMSLLKKMSKTQSTPLDVTIKVEVPSSAMYSVLIDSFEEEEVHKEISTYILNQVDDQLIKESVQASINGIIQNLK
jgi:hypothetical protein